tara:strand:+ start:283 stop:477 length:195 start_codon:yes stop_codon:yes gene_type:complete
MVHVILPEGGNRWVKNLFISRLVKLLLRRLGILYQKVGFLEVSSKLRVNFISSINIELVFLPGG